jgi:hypothetical protein
MNRPVDTYLVLLCVVEELANVVARKDTSLSR